MVRADLLAGDLVVCDHDNELEDTRREGAKVVLRNGVVVVPTVSGIPR